MQMTPRSRRTYAELTVIHDRAEGLARLAAVQASRPLPPPRRAPVPETSAGAHDAAEAR